ncbi:MAG: DUF1287 domain-containing protein [Hespellia sp.]|nr:DUF1287 domain-containing protein [Hespellia sp.]
MKKKLLISGVIALVAICGILFYVLSCYQNTSTERLQDKYDSNIEQMHSTVDKDQDGTDDQVDILEGALNYIASKPKYKSRYYQSGYPDDQYGVCTDVVANALKSAGYDVMELIQEDIQRSPGDYDIDEPDIRIDFRRVSNLKIFFSHTAISLTTDISDVEEWQGGDIVIFKNHIGIVSDRRNENGVSYVIHHNDPYQTAYEQNILETRDDIVGHYRIE